MKRITNVFTTVFATMLLVSAILPGFAADGLNPIEAGDVKWGRNLDEALKKSSATGTPVLVLFQEIPGCIGCRTFGSEVLTNPLLVEAIETLFIPVLVYNNRPGTKDQQWLQRYSEPAWNFQVIRFLRGDGTDLIPRRDRVWSTSGVAARMIDALEKAGLPVPKYLRAVMFENDTANLAQAGFAMACFWTGEYKLGQIDGVVATEAGWYDNREVTLVTYHKKHLSLPKLVAKAAEFRCAQRVYLPVGESIDKSRFEVKVLHRQDYRKASPGDQKKQLENWPQTGALDNLTPMQTTKLNSLLPDNREKALAWLSPSQYRQWQATN